MSSKHICLQGSEGGVVANGVVVLWRLLARLSCDECWWWWWWWQYFFKVKKNGCASECIFGQDKECEAADCFLECRRP